MRGHWVVRLPTWLGDTVMAVPTIRALERAAPRRLTLWGPEPNARLLTGTGVRARTLPYRRRPGARGLLDMSRAVGALLQLGPRGVVLLPNAFEPALLAFAARIPRRIGYATEGRGRLLTDPIPPSDPLRAIHEADRFAELLAPLNLPPVPRDDVLLHVPDDLTRRIRAALATDRPLLGIVPGSANSPAKRWPAESFAALVDRATASLGARVVLLGSKGDAPVARHIRESAHTEVLDLTGRTDVLELAGVLGVCRAVVANDTGAAHLAAALSRPTLVLYGPTDPRRTRPRGPAVRIASIGAFCQPCETAVCPLDHRCMTGLVPDLVHAALASLWHEAGERGPGV